MADSPPAEAPLPTLPPDHPAQAYAGLPAPDLVRHVHQASADLDAPSAQIVFTAFYHRYFRYLMTVVGNSLQLVRDPSAIQEIVDDALAAFFRTSAKFDLSHARDPAGCDLLVRTYLGRLAKWKANHARSFQNSFSASVPDIAAIEAHLQANTNEGQGESSPPASSVEQVTLWLASLPERDCDVIRTYFLDDHPGQKSGRLPDGVATDLAERHGTTPENIRQIKRRLILEIRTRFAHLAS